MIQNNVLKTVTFTQRLLAIKHQRKRLRRTIVAGLMLTSMVDMFSLLVIFLLQSFSNSPEVMALSKGIVLPAAVSASAPIDAPLFSITTEEVLLDQKPAGTAANVLAHPEAVVRALQDMKNRWLATHRNEEFKGDIHLQADKGIPSATVSRFIGLLNSQGYSSVHLAVVNGGRK